MSFCPECRYEYKSEVIRCPECDVDLISELPEVTDGNLPPKEYKDWVHLARLNSQPYAEMLLEALHDKNIPSVILSGSGHFGITGQLGASSYRPIGGGYSLMVPNEFVKDADKEAKIILGEEWEDMKLVDVE